jgi:hypothetical protein
MEKCISTIRVKIFADILASNLENRINEWLENNNIIIERVLQSSSSADDYMVHTTITIFYTTISYEHNYLPGSI